MAEGKAVADVAVKVTEDGKERVTEVVMAGVAEDAAAREAKVVVMVQ